VAIDGWFDTEIARDFTRTLGKELDSIWLDRGHWRQLEMLVGEDYRPRPRDPVTGYPAPQWRPGDSLSPSPTPP
jgi:hypothetical protein